MIAEYYQNKKEDLFIMQGLNGGEPNYSPEALVEEIEGVRQFILEMVGELSDNSTISAKMVAQALQPLNYLSRQVEFRTINTTPCHE